MATSRFAGCGPWFLSFLVNRRGGKMVSINIRCDFREHQYGLKRSFPTSARSRLGRIAAERHFGKKSMIVQMENLVKCQQTENGGRKRSMGDESEVPFLGHLTRLAVGLAVYEKSILRPEMILFKDPIFHVVWLVCVCWATSARTGRCKSGMSHFGVSDALFRPLDRSIIGFNGRSTHNIDPNFHVVWLVFCKLCLSSGRTASRSLALRRPRDPPTWRPKVASLTCIGQRVLHVGAIISAQKSLCDRQVPSSRISVFGRLRDVGGCSLKVAQARDGCRWAGRTASAAPRAPRREQPFGAWRRTARAEHHKTPSAGSAKDAQCGRVR
jgi:hypothetical protein